jgi:hypothetical protein
MAKSIPADLIPILEGIQVRDGHASLGDVIIALLEQCGEAERLQDYRETTPEEHLAHVLRGRGRPRQGTRVVATKKLIDN